MSEKTYAAGRWIGANLGPVAVALVLVLALFAWALKAQKQVEIEDEAARGRERQELAQRQREEKAARDAVRKQECAQSRSRLMKEANAELRAGRPSNALAAVNACFDHLQGDRDFEALRDRATQAEYDVRNAALRAQERAVAARKKAEGVSIGMSEQDVLDSSWGRPQKVNRTIRANYVREQWVYQGGYLYFENGRLTAIQN